MISPSSITSLHMNGAQALPDPTLVSSGEQILFFTLAPLMLAAACGLIFAKKAVHAAMCMAFVMICLAVMYAAQGAQFLFAAQIVVYTGAVMMLFLFVLMLIGVDTADSLTETIKGHRAVVAVAGTGLGLLLVGMFTGIGDGLLGFEPLQPLPQGGLAQANAGGNPEGVARIVFSEHVIALELVGTLLISAALGAITLTHKERLWPRETQPELQRKRVRENKFVAGMPGPGVFARHNAVTTPALLPDGSPAQASVSRVLRARGQDSSADHLGDATNEMIHELHADGASSAEGTTSTKDGDQ